MAALLGKSVVYTVAENERAVSVIDGKRVNGSAYHAGLTRFAAVVVAEDGNKCDLHLFVPKKLQPVFVAGAVEGNGPGTFKVV